MSTPSTFRIILTLLKLHLCGWRQVPGWTVMEMDQQGDVYVAIQLTKDNPQ